MITKQLKQFLLDKEKTSELSFYKLVELLEDSEFDFVDSGLDSIYGLAIDKKGFYDIISLNKLDDQLIYFVILHEYCHVLRINKMGKDIMIKELSNVNIKELSEHIFYEECVADRYACLIYYKFNFTLYPRYRTQRLDNKQIQEEYIKSIIGNIHGMITDEESYNLMVESVIKPYWVDINDEQPIWYENVEIKTEGTIKQHYHRLTDGDIVYYGTLKTGSIIYEDDVTHWRQLKET